VLFPPDPPDATVIPLQHCDSAWKSALDHADLVDNLLATELREGWIRPVPGGDEELRRRYRHTAVGKLGVVVSPDRPPRLVVDSSVSGVTSNTHLPNKAPNPSLADVRKCLPLCPANESLAALVLDVSKAHRRVCVRHDDQGLLCFRHRDVLYQSVTLNFGARASGFYWNRVAGLLVRLTHRLWRVRHSAQIYVDDLLAILLRSSAPLLSALLVVLLCVLRVPMSWHKAALSARVTWIGWSFDFETFTVQLDPSKLRRLLDLLRLLSDSPRCTISALEKLTGKLLWLSNLFQSFRPSLDLRITSPLPLVAIPVGCKLLRIAHTQVSSLKDVPQHISSRRVWVQVANPLRPERELSPESLEVLRMWLALASSPQPFRWLLYRPLFVCEASADACADSTSAGLGGFIRLPDGRQACFAQTLCAELLSDLFPWFPSGTSPQHCIAAWEMLAQ
ncbi:XPT, partial [Symbiodinium pilosum]